MAAGDANKLIRLLLHGLSGPVTVNGDPYDQSMPAFAFLQDAQLAAILTYIRTRWNSAGAITPTHVRENRK
jgi:nitrite reductase (NO-forming)